MRRRQILATLAAIPFFACNIRLQQRADSDVTTWIRYAGRILLMGDSITVGYNDLSGGWRPGLSSSLSSNNVRHTFVGPFSDAYGAHRGVAGTAACLQTSAVQTDCETYDPSIIIISYGINDIGGSADGGQQRTAAQTISSITDVINWCQAGAPQAKIFVSTIIVPQTAGFPSYYSRRSICEEYNSLLPSLCSTENVHMIDVGAPSTSDGVHDDAAGYATHAAAIANTVLAFLPGD